MRSHLLQETLPEIKKRGRPQRIVRCDCGDRMPSFEFQHHYSGCDAFWKKHGAVETDQDISVRCYVKHGVSLMKWCEENVEGWSSASWQEKEEVLEAEHARIDEIQFSL